MWRALASDFSLETSWRGGESSFRAFFDNSPALAFIKDEDGRYVYVNEPLERLYNVPLTELQGKTDFQWFSEETARRLRENDQTVLSTGQPSQFIEFVPTPDGQSHAWMVLKFPFRNRDGHTLIGGMAVDITELKSLETQLTDQLRRANAINDDLTRTNCQLSELAFTDGLTGLKNLRYFRESLDSALSLASRQKRPLSLAMVDVDLFKQYNDTFGHQSGDDVLCALATILRTTVRGYDLVARYGGEEFIILLPDTGLSASRGAAERIRFAVERYAWPHRPVTVSVGVVSMSETSSDANDLIEKADRALYRSKRAGRNRVSHF